MTAILESRVWQKLCMILSMRSCWVISRGSILGVAWGVSTSLSLPLSPAEAESEWGDDGDAS